MLIYLQLIETPEDRSRFEQLYIAYRDLMFYIARKILGNNQDAEDAVHDAFVTVAKKFQKFLLSRVQKPRLTSLQWLRAKPLTSTEQRDGTLPAHSPRIWKEFP